MSPARHAQPGHITHRHRMGPDNLKRGMLMNTLQRKEQIDTLKREANGYT